MGTAAGGYASCLQLRARVVFQQRHGATPVPAPQACSYARPMLKILVRWLLLACALLLVAHLLNSVQVTSFAAALAAALVLGLLNAVVRPLLVILTLPATILTLGLFLFIINAAMFWSAAWMLEGLKVTSFGAALLGSLIYSACGVIIEMALDRVFMRVDEAT
jgi:putative membrane protein